MNHETELGLLLWEKIKDFATDKKKEDMAVILLDTLNRHLDEFELTALKGEDDILDSAIDILDDEIEEEEEEELEW